MNDSMWISCPLKDRKREREKERERERERGLISQTSFTSDTHFAYSTRRSSRVIVSFAAVLTHRTMQRSRTTNAHRNTRERLTDPNDVCAGTEPALSVAPLYFALVAPRGTRLSSELRDA